MRFDHAVDGGGHPAHDRMLHVALDIAEDLPRVAFEPVAVEGLGDHPELDDEVAGKVLGLDVTSLLASPSISRRSKLIAPDFERLARTPWPMACLASSGIRQAEQCGLVIPHDSSGVRAADEAAPLY